MWLFTKYGFYSIVKDENSAVFKVRARARKDLENLQDEIEDLSKLSIHEDQKADYRFRLFINPDQLAALMDVLVKSITYPNFKDEVEVHKDQWDKLDAYHEVWEVMWEYQQTSLRVN